MKTKYINQNEINLAVECLKKGGVAAFPTDTVYGLGVVYDDMEALKRLKLSKGRPESKPIPMMVASFEQIDQVAYTNEKIQRLIHEFMPGGFTIVLKKKQIVRDEVTNGFDTIAIRMPDDSFILEVIRQIKKPLLVTSANLSGMPTGINSEEVIRDFDTQIDMIVLGECKGGISSTIVDASGEDIKILRQGPISEEVLLNVWNQ